MSCDCGGKSSLGRWASGFAGYQGDRLSSYGNKFIKSWTGYGDYTIKSNSLINGSGGGGDPIIETRGRTIRITYREYLGEVTTGATTGVFHPISYTINPANVLTFPWLATIAQQYDQYIPKGIIFEFKSTASDTTATTASLGSVLMATEYDVNDNTFTTKQQMMNAAYSGESKMSENQLHGLECDPSEFINKLYFMKQEGATVTDVRDYDFARVTIATQGGGLPANQSVGSLYVHYDFEFLKEQIHGGLQAGGMLYRSGSKLGYTATSNSLADMFVNASNVSGIDFGITWTGSNIYIPRKWQGALFLFQFMWVGDNVARGAVTAGLKIGCSYAPRAWAGPFNDTGLNKGWASAYTSPATSSSAYAWVQMDDVIQVPYATYGTDLTGFAPGSGAQNCNWQIIVIPRNF